LERLNMPVRRATPEEMLGGRSLVVSGSSGLGRLIREGLRKQAEAKLRAARAREFALRAHGGQLYGTRPYIEHLAEVVSVLEDFGFSGDYLSAGWLHDVIEDTDATVAEVEAEFGDRVAKLVWAVTGGGDRASHVESIYDKIAAFPEAAAVKLADRIANIEACASGDRHSLRYGREHGGFAAAIQPHVPPTMWERYLQALQHRGAVT
jgi:(p)ppGpp synthase/HD superfamily hydrolase